MEEVRLQMAQSPEIPALRILEVVEVVQERMVMKQMAGMEVLVL